jgi:hypothetical protein
LSISSSIDNLKDFETIVNAHNEAPNIKNSFSPSQAEQYKKICVPKTAVDNNNSVDKTYTSSFFDALGKNKVLRD